MPASYAHHRFGQKLLEILPIHQQRIARHFRQLYLAGLQGPDIFFYHSPLFRNKIVKLGSSTHRLSGREFFTHACTCLSSDAASAYLLGLLGHYCLDSVCHPFIHEKTDEGKISHVELESEFDRFLLKSDGIAQPYAYNRGQELQLTRGECETAAPFFPPARPSDVSRSVKKMSRFLKTLAAPKPGRRKLLRKVMSIPKGQLRHHLMTERRNPNCSHLNGELLALFDQALERFPILLDQITAHLTGSTPLGPEFEPDFG